ncbi:uncharacterized protein LAESUDRAFT_501900 [Laetiporus sulphureus 93-53]|uniref:Uncharacterized protein n=1 Tax=Laetiporus sulphureus 93-53 TaxID=1314785 RepID=A0A165BGI1_9APHY|nr:uncharacterized protein LAESUDRAFT_501900 [Laetiporus sulphureus 93-53]KZT01013.1 hypothetical protein LAESUDRAFT_501900 [Laetiporus sulphureus 93-53]
MACERERARSTPASSSTPRQLRACARVLDGHSTLCTPQRTNASPRCRSPATTALPAPNASSHSCRPAPSAARSLARSPRFTSARTHAGDGDPAVAAVQEEGGMEGWHWIGAVGESRSPGIARRPRAHTLAFYRLSPLVRPSQRALPTSTTLAPAHALSGAPSLTPRQRRARARVLNGHDPLCCPRCNNASPPRRSPQPPPSQRRRHAPLTPRPITTALERVNACNRWRLGCGGTTGGGRDGGIALDRCCSALCDLEALARMHAMHRPRASRIAHLFLPYTTISCPSHVLHHYGTRTGRVLCSPPPPYQRPTRCADCAGLPHPRPTPLRSPRLSSARTLTIDGDPAAAALFALNTTSRSRRLI